MVKSSVSFWMLYCMSIPSMKIQQVVHLSSAPSSVCLFVSEEYIQKIFNILDRVYITYPHGKLITTSQFRFQTTRGTQGKILKFMKCILISKFNILSLGLFYFFNNRSQPNMAIPHIFISHFYMHKSPRDLVKM